MPGDEITFGAYEQDTDTKNGKERICWIVPEKEGNELLLISKYVLDCQPYHKKASKVTWETCSLRRWLNRNFLNSAFNKKEQEMILTSDVRQEVNQEYQTDGGKATKDKVFLLSISEDLFYFRSEEERLCKGTDFSYAEGVYETNGNCMWWLRTPGSDMTCAAVSDEGGSIISEAR